MGKIRAKGKKLALSKKDDPGSGEEEKTRAQKRRGRPQKSLNDDTDDEEARNMEKEDSEGMTNGILGNETTSSNASQNRKKRKGNAHVKEKVDSVKEKSEKGTILSNEEESNKYNGFRRNGNRRKNKPCRATEAGLVCT